jgi:hypothetical protein
MACGSKAVYAAVKHSCRGTGAEGRAEGPGAAHCQVLHGCVAGAYFRSCKGHAAGGKYSQPRQQLATGKGGLLLEPTSAVRPLFPPTGSQQPFFPRLFLLGPLPQDAVPPPT